MEHSPTLATSPATTAMVAPRIVQMRAPNADEWTYGGTNTWLLAAESNDRCVVVDPGVADKKYLEFLQQEAESRGWSVTGVLLTHGHEDHSDGARELAVATASPVLGASRQFADVLIGEGTNLAEYGGSGVVLHTPGHSDDSICIDLDGKYLVTGDTLLGGHSSGVFGDFREYLRSIERLLSFTEGRGIAGQPGHGTFIADAHSALERLLAARLRKIEQVRSAIAASPALSAMQLVAQIYPSVTQFHQPSAALMIVGIARHLLDADREATPQARSAYHRLTAEVVQEHE
ncbi:MAG: MBL fold metallo-hydrolase [Actinobacteria bacterium]|nr:MBL fold metallo-hydrolase [Actinomycetota bacterium]